MPSIRTLLTLAVAAVSTMLWAHFTTEPGMPVHITPDHHLEYGAYDNGDRVPDYSWCGYMQSSQPLPTVAARVRVEAPADGRDATALIQQALDYVGLLPLDADGFRGAVLLGPGTYRIDGQLHMRRSGVVLRGSGPSATVLEARGTSKDELIRVWGYDNAQPVGDTLTVSADYVPVGATFVPLTSTAGLAVGQQVRVVRPCTAAWIAALGTDRLGHQQEYNFSRWRPGQYAQTFDRQVVAVRPNGVELDVPLTMSLDTQYGGGQVVAYQWQGRIRQVGIENLECRSTYDAQNPKDENHRWQAVTMDHVQDAWVRRLTARHFAGSAVMLLEGSSRVTVEDCRYVEPVSEVANHRRYAFHVCGQQCLVQRCYSEGGYHDFSVGRGVAGPNAFVQCHAERPYSFSGSTGGMSSGILFDRCTLSGGILNYDYRDIADMGSAWTAANSMCWATRASQTHIMTPPTAHNWGYGLWTQPFGDGYYQCSHTFVAPESLFYAQLAARTDSCQQARLEDQRIFRYWRSSESTRVTPEYAHQMSVMQREPDMRMDFWSDTLTARQPLDVTTDHVPLIDEVRMPKTWLRQQEQQRQALAQRAPQLAVNTLGWMVRGTQILTNGSRPRVGAPGTDGWRGGGSLSHFYPGHTRRGMTEEPDTLALLLAQSGASAMMHHMGLWYDCRRNDHERNMHADAECWAPFNEAPWSRSGVGEAQDRLSLFDLGKFNDSYFDRLRTFVAAADRQGLVLLNEHYFQHNIIEEGAHWCDYPWRGCNNVNNGELRFVERQQFAGDKRVYMAEPFYDVEDNAAVRYYHDLYLRRMVHSFAGQDGVVHSLGLEYTGPLHFARFWLQTVSDCAEHQLVAMTATKDVVDALLADAATEPLIDVVDVRQWHYRPDGSLYAPQGGKSLAPRQWARLEEPGVPGSRDVYRAVREYRDRFPHKAVTYNAARPRRGAGGEEAIAANWAILLAGGSLAPVPPVDAVPGFAAAVAQMQPVATPAQPGADCRQLTLGAAGVGYVAYCYDAQCELDLTADRTAYRAVWLDAVTGQPIGATKAQPLGATAKVKGGQAVRLAAPASRGGVVCLLLKN